MSGKKSPAERRRYPIGTGGGRHPERIERKRAEAEVRNAMWAERPIGEQICSLDARLGKGVGARRQRARLGQVQS